MGRAALCNNCINIKSCKEAECYCSAMNELYHTYNDSKKKTARAFIKKYRKLLSIVDAELSKEYTKLADKVIDAVGELHFIKELDIKVGYIKSYEQKIEKGKIVFAECVLVKEIYQCFVPYDFLIIFYEPNVMLLNPNQVKALMWHELKHIGINERTLQLKYRIIPHEIEDFYSIIDRLGTRWTEPESVIEDITEGV